LPGEMSRTKSRTAHGAFHPTPTDSIGVRRKVGA
jgi:hypothetical protein